VPSRARECGVERRERLIGLGDDLLRLDVPGRDLRLDRRDACRAFLHRRDHVGRQVTVACATDCGRQLRLERDEFLGLEGGDLSGCQAGEQFANRVHN
jgi:hypothetical protein